MDSYGILARYYDALTWDVDYPSWAGFLEKLFRRAGGEVRSVVDLACGTGSLTLELARRGYAVTGVDLSPDMLTVAAEKCAGLAEPPLLLCQDMSRLALLEEVDAVVCCLDSLNYVTSPAAVRRTFRRVLRALRPGGLFAFDIRTPAFLRSMDGQVFLDETEDALCVWRGEFSRRHGVLTYAIDLFLRAGEIWRRESELHRERAYEPDELAQWLAEAGFSSIRQYGDRKLRPPKPGEERVFFTAYKGE